MTHCTTHDHQTHPDLDHDETACVSLVPIFNHLECDQMEEIMRVTHPVTFSKGQTIYQAGDRSDSLYIVSEGKIRITRMSESGKEQLLRLLLPGHFAGELSLFSESIHEDYAIAMEQTSVCTIHRTEFQDILLKYPSIAMKVLAEFSKRLEQSERQAARVATESVETRLAHYLVEVLGTAHTSLVIELPMTKKDLASYLATTPETLSRRLSDLEAQGFIRLISNRKIKILDPDGLMQL